MQKCIYMDTFCYNRTSNAIFPMGILSFQVSQPIRSGKDVSVSIDTIKNFLGKLGERDSLQKKLETQHDSAPSSEESANEVMQSVMTLENDPLTQDLSHSVAGEPDLMELFDQFSRWM